MKMRMVDLRRLLREARETRLNQVDVGPLRGSPDKGFTVRLSKRWDWYENEGAWWKLRKILIKFGSGTHRGMELWRGPGEGGVVGNRPGSVRFLDIRLKSEDPRTAELERQAFIGDLEAAGFDVEAESTPQRSRHAYR